MQKWPKMRVFTENRVFCGLKPPNLKISTSMKIKMSYALIWHILGETNTHPLSSPPYSTFTGTTGMPTNAYLEIGVNAV